MIIVTLKCQFGDFYLHVQQEIGSFCHLCCLILVLKCACMHSTLCTTNTVLLSKSYSLWKLQITPAPVGQLQFLFLCISFLSNSVFLVCFHILSFPPFLTLAFMLSSLCSSSLYLPLSVSLLSVSLCTSAPLSSLSQVVRLSAAYCQFSLPLLLLLEHL